MLKNKEPYLLFFEGETYRLVQIDLLVEIFLFIYVCFFLTKNIYSHTHLTYAGGCDKNVFPDIIISPRDIITVKEL